MEILDYLITLNATVLETMEQINRNTKGIVYVTENEILQGAITDGDIRRYILAGGKLNNTIDRIINTHVKYLLMDEETKAEKVMNEFKIRSVPILNYQHEIVKIYFKDEIVAKLKECLSVPVVIMAGGKGTRLHPYTKILPKPLIPVGEKTITEHIMEKFQEYGCHQFDMIINYKKNLLRAYFDDSNLGTEMNFIEEKEFLGTGGGLKLLQNRYESSFFMTNCDVLVDEDYAKIMKYHRRNSNIVTMVCAEKNVMIPYGTIKLTQAGKVQRLKEKPELSFIVNTGVYVLEPEFIDEIPENTFVHITDIIQKCINERRNVGAYIVNEEQWLDMGQLEELERMKQKLDI